MKMLWAMVCAGGMATALASELAPIGDGERDRSPDGRFAAFVAADDHVAELRDKSGHAWLDLAGEVIPGEAHSVRLVWAPDSRSVAVNFAAGTRYETTRLFRWDGKAFTPLPSPEEAVSAGVIDAAQTRELRAAEESPKVALRRIWISWKAVRWLDASTVLVRGESTHVVGEDGWDLAIAAEARVRFDPRGEMEILEAKEVPVSE